jgi:hypothetical protein
MMRLGYFLVSLLFGVSLAGCSISSRTELPGKLQTPTVAQGMATVAPASNVNNLPGEYLNCQATGFHASATSTERGDSFVTTNGSSCGANTIRVNGRNLGEPQSEVSPSAADVPRTVPQAPGVTTTRSPRALVPTPPASDDNE